MRLYAYQDVGRAFLAKHGYALLADEPGLGKTGQAICAAKSLAAPYFLVICPASVVENWKREIARWWSACPGWNVISFDRATRDFGKVDWMEKGGLLVIDEAHFLKTATSKRTKAVFGPKCDGIGGYAERARHIFLLTGTPCPNHPAELWPMLRACAPELITGKTGKPDTYWQFVSRYCKTINNGFGQQIVGGKNLDALAEKLKPFMLRRTKAEVLPDLPEIRFDELFVEGELPPPKSVAEELQYKMIAKALDEDGVAGLQKIAPHVASLRRVTGLAKVQGVVDWTVNWLACGGNKIVLIAHHREVIDGLFKGLAWFAPVCVTGDSSQKARQVAIDDFQNDPKCRIFIGQIQAAGTGINLTAASDMLFVESSWVPAENQQAAARIHRITQKNACLVRFATLAGSIDERIQRAVARKTADIDALFAAGRVGSAG